MANLAGPIIVYPPETSAGVCVEVYGGRELTCASPWLRMPVENAASLAS